MGGTLTKTTTGLICFAGFETDLDGFTGPDPNAAHQGAERNGVAAEGSLGLMIYADAGWSYYLDKTVDVGTSAKKYISCYGKGGQYHGTLSLILGGTTYWSKSYAAATAWEHSGWKDCSAKNGNQTLRIYHIDQEYTLGCFSWSHFDAITILSDIILKVTNLQPGQKIKVYLSDDDLIGSDTVGGGETEAGVDVSAVTTQPFQGYIEVYDTDGVTLLYTLPTQTVSGGDIFSWSWGSCYMLGPASSLRIYKQGAVGTPKSIAITVTLKSAADDSLVSGKLVNFTTSLGTVSPTSDTTDANGEAHTTLTSGSVHGWAVMKGDWAGDGNAGSAKTFVEVAVYDEADSGDSSEDYQVFVQGTEYTFVGGSYKKSMAFQPQEFEIELSQVQSTIDGPLEVIIYRRGVKDFVGRILKITKSIDSRMVLRGLSNHWKLSRRLVDKSYTDDPGTILSSALARYPAGIGEGDIGIFGNSIIVEFSYDSLTTVVQRLLDITGWSARLNLDDTLDFAPTFGSVQSVSFITGEENIEVTRETDYARIDTRTILIGDPATIVSDKDNATAAGTYGHVEEVFLDKNLTTQATVDIQNQAILDSRDDPIERISGTVVDLTYAADAYDVFDTVTVTDATTGLSGIYTVVSITRDLTDKGSAQIELSSAGLDLQDAFGMLTRNVKDLST